MWRGINLPRRDAKYGQFAHTSSKSVEWTFWVVDALLLSTPPTSTRFTLSFQASRPFAYAALPNFRRLWLGKLWRSPKLLPLTLSNKTSALALIPRWCRRALPPVQPSALGARGSVFLSLARARRKCRRTMENTKKQKCVQESGKEHKSENERGVDCIIIRLQDGCGAHSCPMVNPQALSHVPPRGTLAPSYGRPQAPKPSSSSQMLHANVSLLMCSTNPFLGVGISFI